MTEEEVKKRDILYGMEDELWRLVKRRIGYYLAGVAIVGGVGIWLVAELVVQRVAEAPLKELQKEVMRAEFQADGAKRASDAARTSSEQVTAGLAALNTTLQNLNEQAKAVEVQFKLVTEQINAASDNASLRSQKNYDAVQRRISALEVLVKQIGDENAATRRATAEYGKQMAALEGKVDREQKRFAENSAFTVSILFDPSKKVLAGEVQSRLSALGFRAPLHELPAKTTKGNELTYHGESDAKAQEVLGILKPVVKNVQGKKAPEVSSSKKTYDFVKDGKMRGDIGTPPVMLNFYSLITAMNLDPKNMQLALGAD